MPVASSVFAFGLFPVKIINSKSGLAVRFAEVKEEPQKGGGHVAKRIADPRW